MIQTYVLLDLETTGLPSTHYGDTKITELSLVSVSRKHFNDLSTHEVPRVLNKLTLCFHPQRFLTEESRKITGLTNELLEEQRIFDARTCDLLENFIMGEPQPVCLLAHNGYRFDFPLLQAHTKILGKPLPDCILCSDTLHAFRELKVLEGTPPWHIPHQIIQPYSPPQGDSSEWINSSTELCKVIDEIERSYRRGSAEGGRASLDHIYGDTPPRRRLPAGLPPPPRRRESVPQGPNRSSLVRRNLFNTPAPTPIPIPRSPKPSYRLEAVYRHLKKRDIPRAHSAEGDTQALLECIAAVGQPFHEWVLSNHKKLSCILRSW